MKSIFFIQFGTIKNSRKNFKVVTKNHRRPRTVAGTGRSPWRKPKHRQYFSEPKETKPDIIDTITIWVFGFAMCTTLCLLCMPCLKACWRQLKKLRKGNNCKKNNESREPSPVDQSQEYVMEVPNNNGNGSSF